MKHGLRRSALELRRSKPEAFHVLNSELIKKQLFKTNEFTKSKTVMFYVSKQGEVKTEDMIKSAIEEKKQIIIPIANTTKRSLDLSELKDFDNELEKGSYGILEPKKGCVKAVNPEAVELIIAPGIVFDARGNRIGHGKGYYDNFLRKNKNKIPVIALAYEFQVVNEIKNTGKDVPVDKIITEKRVIDCSCNSCL